MLGSKVGVMRRVMAPLDNAEEPLKVSSIKLVTASMPAGSEMLVMHKRHIASVQTHYVISVHGTICCILWQRSSGQATCSQDLPHALT